MSGILIIGVEDHRTGDRLAEEDLVRLSLCGLCNSVIPEAIRILFKGMWL